MRDDQRNVVYRIHEKNSLKIRRARYGPNGQSSVSAVAPATANITSPNRGKRIAGAAAAAALALAAVPAAAAPNAPASSTQAQSDVRNPSGLLDRWVAKVKKTGKLAMDKLNKVPLPDATPQKGAARFRWSGAQRLGAASFVTMFLLCSSVESLSPRYFIEDSTPYYK